MKQATATLPRPTRWGRPRREAAGEVEDRILGAAARVFLDRGFEGATIDQIADHAQASKPSIYARFANKEAIFCAVIAQKIQESLHWETVEATGATAEERLKAIASALIESALASDTIPLLRSTIAEARRFPHLANGVYKTVRERGAEDVAKLLGEFRERDGTRCLPSFAPAHVRTTARRFVELVVSPFVMRALCGEDISTLLREIDQHVEGSVAFFLAAVRHSPPSASTELSSPRRHSDDYGHVSETSPRRRRGKVVSPRG
jgi:AcrR family transcriptional regulator